jgi:hypothetical protein
MSEVRQQVLIEASPNVFWALITDVTAIPNGGRTSRKFIAKTSTRVAHTAR